MTAAAQQLVHRLPASLADEVPQGDFDAADRRHDGGAALVLIANHPADYGFMVAGVNAQDPIFYPFVNEGLHGLLLPFERCFAKACQARVGRQAHEQVVPQPGVGEERLEADDLNAPS